MTELTRQMVAVMAGVSDTTFNEVLHGGRHRPLPICRYMIARELIRAHMTISAAGREIGLNHSTVIHGLHMLKLMKTGGYETELAIERDFCRFLTEMNINTYLKYQDMELEGMIHSVMPAQSGVSQRSGQPWMSQDYVLSYFWFPNQQNASSMLFRVFGEDRIKQYNLHQGDEVKIRFIIEAHQNSDGRWFNEVRCQAVEHKNAVAPVQPTTPEPISAQAKDMPYPAPPMDAIDPDKGMPF